ncbi:MULTISPECIES: YiaA/YiaB family inner membrane protein [unclassified Coleofasciculus]|uniref:YiaA/YiaB family inner membrane protein n=1 Tax=unclassified Coleofasciculus TaxID=2692782 RepID=UPI00187DDDBC|nr:MULTISPECIES: YiaA/YiaB family inner membrane protein [unclassified Coleofasciculus]MBE9129454.1 hypothetical protein [Coleofasciculus sp. LEGE 07081]MBE9152230.1 hypothetical protein [Coleofasciculus sp. LEGE 07092]
MESPFKNETHSSAWIFQTWASFIISISAMSIGILYLPVDSWTKGFMGMGLGFSVGSTISLSKTTRDIHESKRITSRLDEARVEKLLSEHHPLK